ncbi:histidine phosphatase superfamily [Lasiosphaeria miniovina]|uniref:Histidine phosphatase superfamily n=1 Tax=Lasiosphaeria miniovina TaxID=1954250 RepID=A0AA40AWG3_9PEZI|nr:histidine phosphatase superfamily [Lasiosphaeria miniovina]KAK0723269.1 histidine phosphatase superfamily [Lasiosphaeria miniovina]
MPSTIYLVRHAESAHNASKDFSLRDPGLTEAGLAQASSLAASFPALSSVAAVLASPLTRTLETALAGFGAILVSSKHGGGGSANLILDPDLQERSDLPCDTGSDAASLKVRFPALDFSALPPQWFVKEGANAADIDAVKARAQAVRQRIGQLVRALEERHGGGRQDVVVVTHGVFMKFLAEDGSIDLPKAGWKAFRIGEREECGVALVPVE